MKNRYTPFGYEIAGGEVVVRPDEAEIVQRLYEDYRAGKSLKILAGEMTKRQIPYLPGKYMWNKNRISRLLCDSRYMGREGYPQIITTEQYDMAQQKKLSWNTHETPVTEEVISEAVVPIYCGKCGAQTKRIWKQSAQKRLCTDPACGQKYRISDIRFRELLTEILGEATVDETAIPPDEYERELRRMENDLARLMDTAQPDGEQLRSLIFQIAAKKYEIVSFGRHITDKLRTDLRRANLSDFITRRQVMEMVKFITLLSDDEMEIALINGQRVKMEAQHGG